MIETGSIYLGILVEMYLSLMNDKALIGVIKQERLDGIIFLAISYFPILLAYFLIMITDLVLVTMLQIHSIGHQILRPTILNLNLIISSMLKMRLFLEQNFCFMNLNRPMRLELVMGLFQISV